MESHVFNKLPLNIRNSLYSPSTVISHMLLMNFTVNNRSLQKSHAISLRSLILNVVWFGRTGKFATYDLPHYYPLKPKLA
jgi:hypothetical protein